MRQNTALPVARPYTTDHATNPLRLSRAPASSGQIKTGWCRHYPDGEKQDEKQDEKQGEKTNGD